MQHLLSHWHIVLKGYVLLCRHLLCRHLIFASVFKAAHDIFCDNLDKYTFDQGVLGLNLLYLINIFNVYKTYAGHAICMLNNTSHLIVNHKIKFTTWNILQKSYSIL